MPKQTISYLKSIFVTGARPLQQWWHDVFDSFVHKDDVAVINQGVINSAINQYDSNLKALSADGVVNTLGDVFKVFQNYSDTRSLHNELQWANIPGRPTQAIPLSYSAVQRIAFFNINGTDWPYYTGSGSSVASERSLKGLAGVTTDVVIVDMFFLRYTINIAGQDVNFTRITMVDIALNPRTVV